MMNWLRNNVYAAGLLTILRIYLGFEWMIDGWHKLTGDKAFDAAGFIKGAIAKPVVGPDKTELYPMFTSFLNGFALPNVKLFNLIVPWGEFLVGVGLLLGVLTTAAVFFGMLMNFMYMFAGTVSTNPWMVLIGFFIIAAGYNAGRFGGDYWVVPWIRKYAKRLFADKGDAGVNGPKFKAGTHA